MENKNALLTVKELSKMLKIPENSIRKAILKKHSQYLIRESEG